MTEAKVVEKIEAGADAVWERLGDFTGVQAGPGIDSVAFEGEGVGMVRTITTPNGAVIERLENHDAGARTFTYAIINDDSPLPFANYSATVNIADNGDGTTTVDWTGTFEPRGVDEAKAIKIASGIYTGAIGGARKALTS
jgi:carbon monoxide dehydrogenase subunit G